jgi:putative glutamine amidotransferase
MVNSLHWQGVERLAPGLTVEATAPDGTIEGVRVTDASNFALGVQWHPEWEPAKSAFSMALFHRFGDAARARKAARG